MSNEQELLSAYFEQEMESLEMPPDLASGVILAIESGQRIKEARLMTVSVISIAIIATGLAISYFKLESPGVIAAVILGAFAWFFTAAELRQKQAIYA